MSALDDGIRVNVWSPDGGTPAGLYRFDQPAELLDSFDEVDAAALARYQRDGFLAFRQAFSAAETRAALRGLMACVAGKKKGFDLNVEAGVSDWDKVRDPRARLRRVRKLNAFIDADERLKHLAEHPKLLALLAALMGEPPAMYSNQALLKPPLIGSEKPWHQDMAYFNVPADCHVVGCWIALDEATAENGCMHVIPGSHRDGPVPHHRIRDWQLCDNQIPVAHDQMVLLPPGGALIFSGLLWHGTPPNHSPQTRRALQFHYYPASVARISAEQRLAVWGAEGLGVEC
ncbi:MAG: phytanoyl-CoA dioxygenase family protein [Fimbriimonadaceae bacterium]|nr:phytanoyl-CoA dioxygenase family protein [Fimbriimonadaceae bacterium]